LRRSATSRSPRREGSRRQTSQGETPWSREEESGKPGFHRFLAPESKTLFESHLLVVLSSGSVEKCELKLIRKDGAPLDVSFESLSAKSGEGSAPLIRSAMSDITEQKRAQTALRESEERCRYLFFPAPYSPRVGTPSNRGGDSRRDRPRARQHETSHRAAVNLDEKEGPEAELKRLEIFTSILNNTTTEAKRMQQKPAALAARRPGAAGHPRMAVPGIRRSPSRHTR